MRHEPGVQARNLVVEPRRVASRASTYRWIAAPLVLLDALAITLAMLAAYQVRFHLLAYYSSFSPTFYSYLVAASVPVWLGIFALYRLYDEETLFGGTREYVGVVNACTAGLVFLIFCAFLDDGVDDALSRGWLALTWLFATGFASWLRFAYRRLIYALRRRGHLMRDVLVVGLSREALLVAQQLQDSPSVGMRVVGFIDGERESIEPDAGLPPVLGKLESLSELISRLLPSELLIIPTALTREALLDVYRDWGTDPGIRLRLSSGLYELFTTGVYVRDTGSVPLVSISRTRITGLDAWMKSAVDYLGAFLGIVVLSPLLLLVAILIALDSSGGVIYRRRVVGLNGHSYDAYKFRTMRPDADAYLERHPELRAEWEQLGKVRDDPRITRVGRFLRRHSIDELPQLFNVLRGEMSLVGPRMITPKELAHFGCWRHNLLTVKPGMTGLWQISGRAELSYEERVELDMRYIRNYSIWLDLKILFSTVLVIVNGKGAY